jgi:hypothetical protein
MTTTISFSGINWLAVAAIIVLSFILGTIWHSVLFKKGWSEDSKSIYNAENHGNPLVIFGLSAILHSIAVIGLALFIGNDSTALTGLLNGFIISTVWVSTSIGVTYLFVGRTFRLFLIDAGFYIVFLSLAGLILGAW